MKLTEDETINFLMNYLEQNGWTITSFCLGQKKGNDIVASKSNKTLIIEAKGAKAGENSPTKRREHFDSGQIKTHFGKAIVKILEEKSLYPEAEFGIAHPDDISIKKAIGHLIPFLKEIKIKHYWVTDEKNVIEIG